MRKIVIWLRRRWMEFRWGHGVYLTFFLSFINFLLITYRLLIENIPILNQWFPRLVVYSVFMLIVYIPLAIAVGYMHRKKQLKIDQTLIAEQNPYFAEILRRLKKLEADLNRLGKMLEEVAR